MKPFVQKHRNTIIGGIAISFIALGSLAAANSEAIGDWFDPKGSLQVIQLSLQT